MTMTGSTAGDLERLYVWELPVRLTHWLIFLSVAILAGTGYYLGHPFIAVGGPARDHFVAGTIRVIHLYAAIVFTIAVLVRLYWMFAGNAYARLTEFVSLTRERFASIWQAMRFYAFVRRDPQRYAGHSGLAGASYAAIFFIDVVMIATGLALYTVYAAADSPFQIFSYLAPFFRGLQTIRLIHHIGMWVLLMFVVVHVYFVLLSSLTERVGTVDSIFSGYKFFPRRRHAAGE